ncbi:MAG: hypothetical protein Q7K29_04835 [Thermoleophilia bacterium]|nr:hypothetical protein [Thermoleophilia bacterium]
MKAESYFTLLDGLLATAVYHPHKYKPGAPLRTLFFWSVPLSSASGSPADSLGTTVTRMPESLSRGNCAVEGMGMRTSTTSVCKYCLPL